MKLEIPPDWQDWIKLNISRGCDKDGIARILFDSGFDPAAIVAAMRYLPQSGELIAAMNDSLAAATAPEQELVTESVANAINDVRLPSAKRLATDKVHFYVLQDFFTAAECEELIARIRANNRSSTTTNPDDRYKHFRTSKTSELSVDADAFIQDIDLRISHYMGFEPERSEGIQGQYYQVGEEFKPHTDYFEPGTPEYRKFAGSRGQRTWTFMVYLNDVEEGGQTEFPRLDVTVTPKQGMAVIWNSLRPDGAVNHDTLHWAKPVIKGEKFIITKWFRTYGALTTPFNKG